MINLVKNDRGDITGLKCDCGNVKSSQFGKYFYNEIVIDERGRNQLERREGVGCWKCNEVLKEDELNQLIDAKEDKGNTINGKN